MTDTQTHENNVESSSLRNRTTDNKNPQTKNRSPLPDVHNSTRAALLADTGIVADGEESLTTSKTGITIKSGTDRKKEVPYDKAFERVTNSTNFVLKQLEPNYEQVREQAQGWYRVSLVAAGIGFILVSVGVVTVIIGQNTAGVITALTGIIPEAAAALFFVQSQKANKRIDVILAKLTEARDIQIAIGIVNSIDDLKEQDKLKAEVVRRVLQLENPSSDEN